MMSIDRWGVEWTACALCAALLAGCSGQESVREARANAETERQAMQAYDEAEARLQRPENRISLAEADVEGLRRGLQAAEAELLRLPDPFSGLEARLKQGTNLAQEPVLPERLGFPSSPGYAHFGDWLVAMGETEALATLSYYYDRFLNVLLVKQEGGWAMRDWTVMSVTYASPG